MGSGSEGNKIQVWAGRGDGGSGSGISLCPLTDPPKQRPRCPHIHHTLLSRIRYPRTHSSSIHVITVMEPNLVEPQVDGVP